MIELVNFFHLTLLLVISILMIILLSFLIMKFFKKNNNKKDIFYLIILFFLIFIRTIVDAYLILNTSFDNLFSKSSLIFNLIIVAIIFIILYLLWNKLNKKIIFFVIVSLIALILSSFIFLFMNNTFIKILYLFSILFGIIGLYFLTINFLIDISGKKGINIKKQEIAWKKIILSLIGIILFISLISIGLFLYSLYSQPKFSGELNIYNWDTYVAEDTISNFEKTYGIKVNYNTFEDDNLMFEELKSNSKEYDLVVGEGNLIKEMIKLNLLSELNKKNLPNFKNLDETFINQNYDPKNKYSIPYMWGTTGLIINTKYIPENTDSWDVLWSNKYFGKIGLLLNSEEAVALTSKYVGGPLMPQDNVQFEKIKKFLLLQKPLLKGYILTADLQDLLVSEELWALNIYNGNAVVAIAENPNLKYIIPKEGATIWIDNWAIPKNAKNKRNAELFINYILEPKVNADITNEVKYATANKAAEEFLDSEVLEDPIIYPDEETIKRLDSFANYEFSDEMNLKIFEFWNELTGGAE